VLYEDRKYSYTLGVKCSYNNWDYNSQI